VESNEYWLGDYVARRRRAKKSEEERRKERRIDKLYEEARKDRCCTEGFGNSASRFGAGRGSAGGAEDGRRELWTSCPPLRAYPRHEKKVTQKAAVRSPEASTT
jgi:hypothetical protein